MSLHFIKPWSARRFHRAARQERDYQSNWVRKVMVSASASFIVVDAIDVVLAVVQLELDVRDRLPGDAGDNASLLAAIGSPTSAVGQIEIVVAQRQHDVADAAVRTERAARRDAAEAAVGRDVVAAFAGRRPEQVDIVTAEAAVLEQVVVVGARVGS